jgi:hypothetical protein
VTRRDTPPVREDGRPSTDDPNIRSGGSFGG